MRLSYDFTIPLATGEVTPHIETIRLDTGTITQTMLRFKAGCHNRVYVALFAGLVQIVPAHETQALYGDDVIFTIPMNYELTHKPYELTFKGWSPDTRYNHTISVWIDLLENDPGRKQSAISNILHLLGGS